MFLEGDTLNDIKHLSIIFLLCISCGTESEEPNARWVGTESTIDTNSAPEVQPSSADAEKNSNVSGVDSEQSEETHLEIPTLDIDFPPDNNEQESVSEESEEAPVVDEDMRGYTDKLVLLNNGAKMSCDSIWQDKFVFQGLGPEYGDHFLIVWSDGKELYVPNSSQMIMDVRPGDYRKFQPGGVYSDNNPDIPSMEVYAARGSHPESVTIYYNTP